MSQSFIALMDQYGEVDTIRDYLAVKDNTDDFARRDCKRKWTIPLGVE
ncbi:hypothetical protein LAZ40_21280 [Cereibacter sphaeroides]|nr:hypothetical protein [Cereibacter sphaeroides]MCE6961568.1 hypothetical protein [Cereibacter sphaeroides]MCE6967883.1 hypothetical protein [Cereibacter sphaeroides]MCE6971141.1 hypothetical protein [Cereibacter sphaeroides]